MDNVETQKKGSKFRVEASGGQPVVDDRVLVEAQKIKVLGSKSV